MSDVVTPLLQWLNANPELAGLVTFVVSAAESVAIIGTIVPGSITMTAIGALAGAGVIPLYQTLLWAMLGAIVGDGVSYWLGYYFKDRLRNCWPFRNNPNILKKGEHFFHRYGVMSVFIGRFVGPVRALVPLVAGMLGMRPVQFTIANITSAIGWAPVYMLPGILLGAAALELPPDIAVHVILVLFLMFLFAILCFWIVYKFIGLIQNQIEQSLTWLWNALKRSRYFFIATILLKHHDPKEHHGQLILAFYCLLTTTLFVLLAYYVKTVGASEIFVNDAIFHLFRGIRSERADTVMACISLLGQKQVILPVVVALCAWLIYCKRLRAALHVLALGVFSAASIYFIKNLIQSPRPWGIMNSPDTYSMPSGHTTLSMTIYLGIAFLITRTMPSAARRWLIYLPAALVALLVAVSRLYLGAHWFTDILAAWLLSAALLMLIILSYNRQKEKPLALKGITVTCLLTLCISYSFYYLRHFDDFKRNYEITPWPATQIAANDWWGMHKDTEALRLSLFGFPSQYINVQWAGQLDVIEKTLLSYGWGTPPARDLISTIHRITDIKSGEYLPLVSPQYRDKKPVLILAKYSQDGKKLFVIRLWESGYIFQHSTTPLWVGTVGIVPRSYSWLFRQHEDKSRSIPNLVLPTQNHPNWEWKLATVEQNPKAKYPKKQSIILIRSKK